MENLVRKRTANLQQRTLELEEERARTDNLLKGRVANLEKETECDIITSFISLLSSRGCIHIDLKEAKEVAEAAAASKQNFLANMSHGEYLLFFYPPGISVCVLLLIFFFFL